MVKSPVVNIIDRFSLKKKNNIIDRFFVKKNIIDRFDFF